MSRLNAANENSGGRSHWPSQNSSKLCSDHVCIEQMEQQKLQKILKLVAKTINNKNNHTRMFTVKLCQIEKANNFSWTQFTTYRFKSKGMQDL